jgi:hypothetical protein
VDSRVRDYFMRLSSSPGIGGVNRDQIAVRVTNCAEQFTRCAHHGVVCTPYHCLERTREACGDRANHPILAVADVIPIEERRTSCRDISHPITLRRIAGKIRSSLTELCLIALPSPGLSHNRRYHHRQPLDFAIQARPLGSIPPINNLPVFD